MKRLMSFILLIALLLSSIGCRRTEDSIRVPASFYYCTYAESYETAHMVIDSETRESESFQNDLAGLLNEYFKGPNSEDLVNPFPENVKVEFLSQEDGFVEITLSSRFARLTGMDLTLACACICMTVMDYYACSSVSISVQNALLDGSASVTMTRDELLLESTTEELNENK